MPCRYRRRICSRLKWLARLQRLGIVADVSLFHAYDDGHWGVDCPGGRDADRYDTAADVEAAVAQGVDALLDDGQRPLRTREGRRDEARAGEAAAERAAQRRRPLQRRGPSDG